MKNPIVLPSPYLSMLPGEIGERGSLNYFEDENIFPNGIRRCFWITKVDESTSRGNHAHLKESQLLVALSGVATIAVTAASGKSYSFLLDSPSQGLFVPPLHWISVDFSSDAVLLGMSDLEFSEEDYIRNITYFESLRERYI